MHVQKALFLSGVLCLFGTGSTRPLYAGTINSVSGTVSHGNTLTVSGIGFGTKSNPNLTVPAAPILWDIGSQQFIGGVNRNAYSSLSDSNFINTQVYSKVTCGEEQAGGEATRYTMSRAHRNPFVSAHYYTFGPKLCVGMNDFIYPGATNPSTPQKAFYLSFYRKVRIPANTGVDTGTTKIMRLNTVPPYSGSGVGNTFLAHMGYFSTDGDSWINAGTETNWVRWEMYVDDNRHWFDVYKNGHYHQGGNSGLGGNVEIRPAADWRYRLPGLSGNQWGDGISAAASIVPAVIGIDYTASWPGQETDLGELYYDNTLARVEISNQPAWNESPSATAQREVQGRLLTWSNSSVSFNFYQGGFTNGQAVFLYIIDSNGGVNQNGYPLVIGDTPPPPAGSACDLNSDSTTNVSDVQLCANQAIGVVTCSAGDINNDTSCNVIDVQRVVNAALGGQCVTQ